MAGRAGCEGTCGLICGGLLQLCVRREMKEGLGAEWYHAGYDGEDNVIELSER